MREWLVAKAALDPTPGKDGMSETVTYDPDEWQLVPRKATRDMLMDLQHRAGDIAKLKRNGTRLEFHCDFGLIYRLMLAAAPVLEPTPGRNES